MAPTIIRAKESFTFTDADGTPVTIAAGETFAKNAKRLKGISKDALDSFFEDFSPDHDVEQATAVPGEKRTKS